MDTPPPTVPIAPMTPLGARTPLAHPGLYAVIAILSVVIVVGAAWVFWPRTTDLVQQTPSPSAHTPPQSSPAVTVAASTPPPPTSPTAAPVASDSGWVPFSSRYFTLSFNVPAGYEVRDSQNHIAVYKAPYQTTEIGSDNSFFSVVRYDTVNTRAVMESQFRANTRDIVTSLITIDGTSFTRLDGIDNGAFEGNSGGRAFVILLDRSALYALERPMNQSQTFDPIKLAGDIIATMKFSK